MKRILQRLPGFGGGGTARNTLWAAGGDLMALVTTLVVFYFLTQELGPGGYGYFVGAQVLVATLSTFSSGAVCMLLMQEVVREGRSPQEVLAACSGLALVAGALGVLLSVPLALLLLPGMSLRTVALFALAQLFGTGLLAVAATTEQALGHYPRSVLLGSSANLVRVLAVLALVLADRVSLLSLALTFCLLNVAAAVVGFALVQRRHGLLGRPRLASRADLRRGLSYAGTLLSFGVQEDADKMLLVRFADPVVAGLYAAAYRGVQMATLPLRALLSASHRSFLQPSDGRPGEHVRRSLRVTVPAAAYATVATLALIAVAPLVPRLLGPEYDGSELMFMVLAPLVLLRSLGHLAFNGLMGLGRNDVRFVIIVACAVISVVLTLVLIPLYSWAGAAVATLASEAVFAALTWVALVRCQRQSDRALLAPAATEPLAEPAVAPARRSA